MFLKRGEKGRPDIAHTNLFAFFTPFSSPFTEIKSTTIIWFPPRCMHKKWTVPKVSSFLLGLILKFVNKNKLILVSSVNWANALEAYSEEHRLYFQNSPVSTACDPNCDAVQESSIQGQPSVDIADPWRFSSYWTTSSINQHPNCPLGFSQTKWEILLTDVSKRTPMRGLTWQL